MTCHRVAACAAALMVPTWKPGRPPIEPRPKLPLAAGPGGLGAAGFKLVPADKLLPLPPLMLGKYRSFTRLPLMRPAGKEPLRGAGRCNVLLSPPIPLLPAPALAPEPVVLPLETHGACEAGCCGCTWQ